MANRQDGRGPDVQPDRILDSAGARRPLFRSDTGTHTEHSAGGVGYFAHDAVAFCFRHGLRWHHVSREERGPARTSPLANHGVLLRTSLPRGSAPKDCPAYQLGLPVNLWTLHHKNRVAHTSRPRGSGHPINHVANLDVTA